MKLGVIGEPCVDYIHREGPAGKDRQNAAKHYGGILYSVVSLAVIAKKNDEIYPIMNLGEDEYDNIAAFLSKFRNIRTDFIFKSPHKTRVVKLFYKAGTSDPICHGSDNSNTYDREESSTEPAPPLNIEQIRPAAEKMDGMLVNMVSGKDMGLATLQLLRNEFKGFIHMDLHNIVMKTSSDGTRLRAPLKDWLKWCVSCDTLQMNEAEISVLSEEGLNEYETAEKIFSTGKVQCIIITRGRLGVTMYIAKKKSSLGEDYSELDKIDIPALETPHFRDSTGCGDVFASAFFYRTLENTQAEYSASLHFANRLASRKSEFTGVEELEKLNG